VPASYRIDVHAGVVFSVFEGRVTNEELLEHQQRLATDPEVAVTAFGIRLVATPSIFAPGSRRAIIEGDVSSSYVRMFQTLRSQSGEDIRNFSTVEDAHRWLGLDVEA
jgi:hypothetical protein